VSHSGFVCLLFFFFFQAEDGIRDWSVTGVRRVLFRSSSCGVNFIPVGPDYFDTVGVRLVAGRKFTPQDDEDHPGVAIVNESFVRSEERRVGKEGIAWLAGDA